MTLQPTELPHQPGHICFILLSKVPPRLQAKPEAALPAGTLAWGLALQFANLGVLGGGGPCSRQRARPATEGPRRGTTAGCWAPCGPQARSLQVPRPRPCPACRLVWARSRRPLAGDVFGGLGGGCVPLPPSALPRAGLQRVAMRPAGCRSPAGTETPLVSARQLCCGLATSLPVPPLPPAPARAAGALIIDLDGLWPEVHRPPLGSPRPAPSCLLRAWAAP